MIIKKLNTVFHKHSRVLFGAFTLIIIVSFLGFLTPGQFGCGDMQIGAPAVGEAYGKKVTIDDLRETQRQLSIFSEAFMGQRVDVELEQVFFFYCARVKAERLGIRVGSKEIGEAISEMPMLMTNGKFDNAKYKAMIAGLERLGVGEEELIESIRTRLVIGKLQSRLAGNAIVTDSEVEEFFRMGYTKYQAAAAAFTADSVKTVPTAAQLEEFFKAHRDAYKVEGKLSAVVAAVPAAEFAAQVNKSATKERLEKFFRDNSGLFAGKDGKQPAFDAVRGEVRKRFVAIESLELAKRKAYDFASSIYEEMNEIPAEKRGEFFASAAAKHGLAVQPAGEAAFSGDTLGKIKSRELVRALAGVADSNPVTDAIAVGNQVCVGCRIRIVPTRPAELKEVKTRVIDDWKLSEARKLAATEAVKLQAIADPAKRLQAFRALKNVKFTDFSFTKLGNPAPPAGLEVAMQLVERASGSSVAIPDGKGSQLLYLIRRVAPDAKAFAAEKERCATMCRFFKQSLAGAELTEDISANCIFTMNQEGHRH